MLCCHWLALRVGHEASPVLTSKWCCTPMNTRKKLALRGNDLREELQADDAEADDPLREVSLQANGASPERLKGRQKPSTPHKLGA
jgi:hypothetical protein